MTKARSNATANAAKGDLRAGTGTNTSGILSVGSDGYTLVADSAATTGLNYVPTFFAGKNKVINGDFGIWQRGTSFSNPSAGDFSADRFKTWFNGTGATRTISQQTFTPGTAPVTGYEGTYFFRHNVSVAGTGNTYNILQTRLEDVRLFAGQTVTLSWWAKADTNRTINSTLVQVFGSGGSADVTVGSGATKNITTSWQRFSDTFTIPSIAGKTIGTGSYFEIDLYLPSNTTFTLDIWGVQLEAGSTATPFTTATGTIQGELAACQRYYFRSASDSGYKAIAFGYAGDATNMNLTVPFPTAMRVAPTAIDTSAMNTFYYESSTSGNTPTSISIGSRNTPTLGQATMVKSSAFTAGYAYSLLSNNTAAYIGFSSEL